VHELCNICSKYWYVIYVRKFHVCTMWCLNYVIVELCHFNDECVCTIFQSRCLNYVLDSVLKSYTYMFEILREIRNGQNRHYVDGDAEL
jgi:hypothetical protein